MHAPNLRPLWGCQPPTRTRGDAWRCVARQRDSLRDLVAWEMERPDALPATVREDVEDVMGQGNGRACGDHRAHD
jgi:hypothetical protein